MSVSVRVLVLVVAAIGFLFDTYELLMFPVIGADAVAELMKVPVDSDVVRLWIGRMLWIAALCGGVFGLLGGMLIDRFGRRTIMAASILVYSLSPVCAAFSSDLWMLILFRCTTFVGVCVEMVAAVTWLAELFDNKRAREQAIGWTLAAASLGGILVTLVYNYFVDYVKANDEPIVNLPFPLGADAKNLAWRYTLLTGLVPGLLILLLLPFVPESKVWRDRKAAGTLLRPRLSELFAPGLIRTTLVTTVLSACSYAAAFGALQLTPSQMAPGFPAVAAKFKEGKGAIKKAEDAYKAADEVSRKALQDLVDAGGIGTEPGTGGATDKAKAAQAAKNEADAATRKAEQALKGAKAAFGPVAGQVKAYRGNIQLHQELGGLLGRVLLAILLMFLPSKTLLRVFLVPGIILFPVTYLVLFNYPYAAFAAAIFFCGLLTVAQFSYMSEFLPKVFPLHLRGTGGGFATNVGGRMLGTMAALVNTELLSPLFKTDPPNNPVMVATAAAWIGGAVFLIAFVMSFVLPEPKADEKPAA